jgi:DNA repair protein RadD
LEQILSNLRYFQTRLKQEVNAAFAANMRYVMLQLSTGGGKTVIMGSIAKDHAAAPWNPAYPGGCAIAHRSELVSQISQQLAREGVEHDIIAPQGVVRGIVNNHVEELGRPFYNARAAWRVASIDTINRRSGLDAWFPKVGMLFIDEAHHVLEANKWGKGVKLFPNARGVLPTATPIRADGKGLGKGEGGIADCLVEGPPMRQLINEGYLTDYKWFAVQASDLELDGVKIGASGDFNPEQLREAVHKSKAIVGDVVRTYMTHAMGKLGVTFAVDIEEAQKITDAFNRAGVPAALLTGEDSDEHRRAVLRRFKNRELWQLVNVDLFGEGFDLPAIECVSLARPTESFSLYSQMVGRALRLMISAVLAGAWDTYSVAQRLQFIKESGKPYAFIFDHVGNFYRHEGPPDRPYVWSLVGRSRSKNTSGGIPMRTCLNPVCAFPYERIHPACPFCGTAAPEPAERSAPNLVDGDITLIDPALMAMYRKEIERIDGDPVVPYGAPRTAVVANHMKRRAAQYHLREAITAWSSSYREDVRVNMRRFWFAFNIDVMAAKTLNEKDAGVLKDKILADMSARGKMLPESLLTEPETA